jgi:cytochrome c553
MTAARAKAQVCFACHGPDGNSTVGEYPILAGQSWRYIYIELKDFKEGRRSDEQMSPVAEKLSTEDMTLLGEFFAAQEGVEALDGADGDAADVVEVGRGEVLDVVEFGEEAAGIRRAVTVEFIASLLAEIRAVNEEEDAASPGVFDEA